MIPLNEQKKLPQQAALWKPHWNWLTQNHTKVLRFTHLAQKTNQSHETSWNLERVHIYMHVRPWLKWWNSNRPVHRRRVFWHGLGFILSFKQGMAHKILWMTKLSGFLGQEFHPGSENRESTQFLLVRHLRSLKISWISSIQRPTSPCLDILVTSFGFLSIVQTPVLLGASRTKVGENAWIAWVLETRSSC